MRISDWSSDVCSSDLVTVDGGPAIWDGFVVPFVMAGEGYQGQYPLLVSDRYLIVDAALQRAAELGTRAIAHGCTGMGNDQVRFDLTVKASGDYTILAPIREIQKEHTQVRAYEQRSEEHTSELQSLMRISYAVFCLKKKQTQTIT